MLEELQNIQELELAKYKLILETVTAAITKKQRDTYLTILTCMFTIKNRFERTKGS